MIISRTPFRISFFGGGTDYPSWVKQYGGSVIGASINHFCYISCRYLPPFFDHKYRICYSKTENKKTIEEIDHPAVNAVLRHLDFHNHGLEIHHDADLPARTGLGSSSAFVVGALNALNALRQKSIPKERLAELAIHIEQEVLKETVGSQDQVLTAHGGFNRVDFSPNGKITVHPVIAPIVRVNQLQSHLMLFFTGFSRFASEVAKSKVENFQKKTDSLRRMLQMVDEALEILQNEEKNLSLFGELLHESWLLKRDLSEKVSSPEIDAIYDKAYKAGAIGGKLLGAGGGGFMLFFVPIEKQPLVKQALSHLIHVPFGFENSGSTIIMYQSNGFQSYEK